VIAEIRRASKSLLVHLVSQPKYHPLPWVSLRRDLKAARIGELDLQ
jgi:hypothetical protein